MTTWRWRLRTWSPDYDRRRALPAAVSAPRVDAGREVVERSWSPRRPARTGADQGAVVFVDGVQRIDAWADLEGPGGEQAEALFASVAAGSVRVENGGRAVVVDARVRRLLIGGPAAVPALSTSRGETYLPYLLPTNGEQPAAGAAVGAPDGTALEVVLQVARDDLEVEVASAAADEVGALVVVDGPLHHRDHLREAVGHIKSHRVDYLADPWLRDVVAALAPGERTPLFIIDTGRTRWSWYSRLAAPAGRGGGRDPLEAVLAEPPGPTGWAGLVRGEGSGRLDLADAAALADRATRTVARFASSPVKDSRAPQNLVPVGGLERILRHRLGERELLERSLRAALAR
jgi:hypothetical protein